MEVWSTRNPLTIYNYEVDLLMEESALIAIISGGRKFTHFASEPLKIFGTETVDPDDSENDLDMIIFTWTCQDITDPNSPIDCLNVYGDKIELLSKPV